VPKEKSGIPGGGYQKENKKISGRRKEPLSASPNKREQGQGRSGEPGEKKGIL